MPPARPRPRQPDEIQPAAADDDDGGDGAGSGDIRDDSSHLLDMAYLLYFDQAPHDLDDMKRQRVLRDSFCRDLTNDDLDVCRRRASMQAVVLKLVSIYGPEEVESNRTHIQSTLIGADADFMAHERRKAAGSGLAHNLAHAASSGGAAQVAVGLAMFATASFGLYNAVQFTRLAHERAAAHDRRWRRPP